MGEKTPASPAVVRRAWRERPISMLGATVLGIGMVPGGPGTYAAIVWAPVVWWLSRLGFGLHVALFAAATVVSVVWSHRAGEALGVPDSRRIVVDEVVGVWLSLLFFVDLTVLEAVVGLVAFRVFDIWKPPPIRRVDETLPGGIGVVADDLVAGLYAAACVAGLRYLF